jgi:hypothetical protein
VWGGEGGAQRFFLESWWPFAEPWKWVEPLETARESLSPLFKAAIESASRREIYYDRPFEEYPGQRQKFAGHYLPTKVVWALRQFRAATDIHRAQRRIAEAETPGEKAAAAAKSIFFGSRLYGFDPQREAKKRYHELREQASKIRTAIKWAEENNDFGEAARLQDLLLKIEPQLEELRLDAGY